VRPLLTTLQACRKELFSTRRQSRHRNEQFNDEPEGVFYEALFETPSPDRRKSRLLLRKSSVTLGAGLLH